jgi:hypothetical protein
MTITIEVEVEGNYRSGKELSFNKAQEQWYPGEPEEIEGFKVFLTRFSKKENGKEISQKLEITDWLSSDEYEEIYNQYLEEMKEES